MTFFRLSFFYPLFSWVWFVKFTFIWNFSDNSASSLNAFLLQCCSLLNNQLVFERPLAIQSVVLLLNKDFFRWPLHLKFWQGVVRVFNGNGTCIVTETLFADVVCCGWLFFNIREHFLRFLQLTLIRPKYFVLNLAVNLCKSCLKEICFRWLLLFTEFNPSLVQKFYKRLKCLAKRGLNYWFYQAFLLFKTVSHQQILVNLKKWMLPFVGVVLERGNQI